MRKSTSAAMLVSLCTGYLCGKHACEKKERKKREKIQKYLSVYKSWLDRAQQGDSIADVLKTKQYESIAIYGLGKFGVSLINELRARKIQIAYIIDQRADEIFYQDLEVYALSDALPSVGAVVITTVNGQQELKEKVERYMDCDVYTLEELLLG